MKVSIDSRYWSNIPSDYSRPCFAWIREAGQNSLDAKASIINIKVKGNLITWEDNGIGMTRNTLVNKLFSMGASGKEFRGTLGGYGVAKALLFFCQEEYIIRTKTFLVEGQGSEFKIRKSEATKGTTLQVKTIFSEEELIASIKEWVSLTDSLAAFTLNGETILSWRSHQELTRERSWFKIYKAKEPKNNILIRVQGQLMSVRNTTYDGAIIIEVNEDPYKVLQTNRDWFKYPYSDEIEHLINILTQNPEDIIFSYPMIEIFSGQECSFSNYSIFKALEDNYGVEDLNQHHSVTYGGHNEDLPPLALMKFQNTPTPHLPKKKISIFQKTIELINENHPILIGLVDKDLGIYYSSLYPINILAFNPVMEDPMDIMITAIHEYSHIAFPSHSDNWAGHFTSLIKDAINNGLFNKVLSSSFAAS